MINEFEKLKCRSFEDDTATFESSISAGREIANSFSVNLKSNPTENNNQMDVSIIRV